MTEDQFVLIRSQSILHDRGINQVLQQSNYSISGLTSPGTIFGDRDPMVNQNSDKLITSHDQL